MDEAIDESRGHDVVAKDVAPLFEALIRREHRGRVLVPPCHQLKKEHRAGAPDREIADLIDDQQRRIREYVQPRRVTAQWPDREARFNDRLVRIELRRDWRSRTVLDRCRVEIALQIAVADPPVNRRDERSICRTSALLLVPCSR